MVLTSRCCSGVFSVGRFYRATEYLCSKKKSRQVGSGFFRRQVAPLALKKGERTLSRTSLLPDRKTNVTVDGSIDSAN